MKKMTIGLFAVATMLVAVPEAMADHHGKHHGKGNDGLRLAAGIVNLIKEIVAPAPKVVYAPPPTVIAPQPHVYRKPEPPKPPKPPKPHRDPRKGAKHKPQPPRGGHKR